MTGVAAGVGADEFGANWTVDAASGRGVPASAAEWSAVLGLAGIAGTASFLYGCQEASGDLTDVIGGVTLTATGSPAYAQARSGWSRKFITLTEAATMGFASTSASLPNIASEAFTLFAYLIVTAVPALQRFALVTGTNSASFVIQTNQKPQARSSANTASGNTTIATAVVPVILKCDFPNSTVAGYTLGDKMTPTFSAAMTGKQLCIGPSALSSNAPPIAIGYLAGFRGAAAQWADAQARAVMRALGSAPTW